jgi:hypothetical protein
MVTRKGYKKEVILIGLVILFLVAAALMYRYFVSRDGFTSEPIRYISTNTEAQKAEVIEAIPVVPRRVVTHVKTPEAVKAVYISSWVAGTKSFRDKIIKMIDETELNAIVIDVKDSTGWISFSMEDPILDKMGSFEKRIADTEELLDLLHSKNIYVIARISAFQDPALVKKRPDLAVLKASTGAPWADRKGMTWVDPGSREAWDYLIAIGKEAHKIGFDELNYDYIRFPSDGNMSDIKYRHYDGTVTKAEKIREFFEYLHNGLAPIGVPLSADLFGMTTTNKDDLNIGQILENALPYFDYIAPMVYPSHYPTGFHNYKNPAAVPYEIIKIAMGGAVERAIAASTSPNKMRPWLQDFDMGATYTPEMVRAQIQATYDVGLNSWMLWDPSNKYTPSALLPE